MRRSRTTRASLFAESRTLAGRIREANYKAVCKESRRRLGREVIECERCGDHGCRHCDANIREIENLERDEM